MKRDERVHFESVEKGLDEDQAGSFEPDSSSLDEKADPTEESFTLAGDGDTGGDHENDEK
jgi:hypothetical protein